MEQTIIYTSFGPIMTAQLHTGLWSTIIYWPNIAAVDAAFQVRPYPLTTLGSLRNFHNNVLRFSSLTSLNRAYRHIHPFPTLLCVENIKTLANAMLKTLGSHWENFLTRMQLLVQFLDY